MKKAMFKIVALSMLIILILPAANAQDMSLGVALKGSTMGPGGDVVFQFHEKMTARLGYDYLGLGPYDFSFEESDISYNASAKVKTGSITALYDYYIAKIFFVSAGFGINNFNVSVSGRAGSDLPWGDISVPKDKIGDFDITVNPGLKVSPYLGVGLGRTLSTKLVGFAFEIGTYYMGGPNVNIESTGLIAPTSDPEKGQAAVLENQISQYYLYPVVKLNLSFKITSF